MSESADAGKERPSGVAAPHRRMAYAFKWLGVTYLVGTVAQHVLWRGGEPAHSVPVIVGLAVFLAVMSLGLADKWRRFFASVFFAVPALLVLTFFSVLGTLVLQNEPAAAMREKYGGLAALIEGLFLGDVFHSLGFCALVGMGAGGMALVAVRKRGRTPRALGSRLAHLGLLLVLAGAAIGNVWGIKGRLELHVGNSADAFVAEGRRGKQLVPLGFTVRLEDFRVERYRPDYQLMVYDTSGGREKRLLRAKAGVNSPELARHGLQVLAYFADYRKKSVVEPLAEQAPAQAGEKQAARLELPRGGHLYLLAAEAEEELAGLLFFPTESQALRYLEEGAAAGAGTHLLQVGERRVVVRAGDRVALENAEEQALVKAVYLDFVIDPEGGRPTDRSAEPRNPALELYILDASGAQVGKRFLFANHPDFHGAADHAPGGRLRYDYLPPRQPPEAILVGEPAGLWTLSGWEVKEKAELDAEGRFEWRGRKLRLAAIYPRAAKKMVEETASENETNPLLRLKAAGRAAPLDLVPGEPRRIGQEKIAVLAPRGGDTVKDYFSTLAVLQDGREVKRAVVEVNGPLGWGGFSFYQSNFRPEDPTYSGLQVVRDPGIPLTYLGFAVNFAGIFCALWLPKLRRKPGAAAKRSGEGHHA